MVSHIYRHVLGINVFSLQLSVTWEKLETVYVFFKPGSGCIVRCISFLYLFLRRNFTMILTVPNKKIQIKDLRKQWVRPPPPPLPILVLCIHHIFNVHGLQFNVSWYKKMFVILKRFCMHNYLHLY